MRIYNYVGPGEIAKSVAGAPVGISVASGADVIRWMRETGQKSDADGTITATFVVDLAGALHIADRRSEHVACASGQPVLSAGEIAFDLEGGLRAVMVTNQSTGYCPEPQSWGAVAAALDAAGIARPRTAGFEPSFEFRRCPSCAAVNVVREGVFLCSLCGAAFPLQWNLDAPPSVDPA